MSVQQGMRVNMTLCFSQEEAATVYAATKGATGTSSAAVTKQTAAKSNK